MNRIVIGGIAVLVVLLAGLAVAYAKQSERKGELEYALDVANGANKQWQQAYEELGRDLDLRQQRLDEVLLRDHQRTEQNKEKERLFRTEIDQLKAQNHELKQLLESRIPDSILVSLCRQGYASSAVCAGLLPSSR